MKQIIILATAALAITTMSGCATILKGKTQQVNIATSNNEQATITIDGKVVTAPSIVEITRKNENLVVSTSTKGCTPTSVSSAIEPVFFVNILSGGPFGSTTDYATGSMWKYDENIMINCK